MRDEAAQQRTARAHKVSPAPTAADQHVARNGGQRSATRGGEERRGEREENGEEREEDNNQHTGRHDTSAVEEGHTTAVQCHIDTGAATRLTRSLSGHDTALLHACLSLARSPSLPAATRTQHLSTRIADADADVDDPPHSPTIMSAAMQLTDEGDAEMVVDQDDDDALAPSPSASNSPSSPYGAPRLRLDPVAVRVRVRREGEVEGGGDSDAMAAAAASATSSTQLVHLPSILLRLPTSYEELVDEATRRFRLQHRDERDVRTTRRHTHTDRQTDRRDEREERRTDS